MGLVPPEDGTPDAPFTDFAAITPDTDLSTLNLNWHERDLPERQRTKHVHRLHPYLGKYIPQIVEIFLRKFAPRTVFDPFSGSGTTLVEAKALGITAVGCDVSAFNCLLTTAKTDTYDLRKLEREIHDILQRANRQLLDPLDAPGNPVASTSSDYLRQWFHPQALGQLLCFRNLIADYEHRHVLKIILSRSARSARLTTHFDLDFPKQPATEPYYCHKHRRTCKPTDDAWQFLNRYALDTLERIKEFAAIAQKSKVTVLHQDARTAELPTLDLVLTSPPYVGLIDYHEQHRYAYELLELPLRAEQEIGAAFKGGSKRAKRAYCDEISQVFANLRPRLNPQGRLVVIVNDKFDLYTGIAGQSGFRIEQRLRRRVNRRTGRRAAEFFEEILICRRND
jgi:DNA modification methylase